MANSYQFDPKFQKRHKGINIPNQKKLESAFQGFRTLIDLMNEENEKLDKEKKNAEVEGP